VPKDHGLTGNQISLPKVIKRLKLGTLHKAKVKKNKNRGKDVFHERSSDGITVVSGENS